MNDLATLNAIREDVRKNDDKVLTMMGKAIRECFVANGVNIPDALHVIVGQDGNNTCFDIERKQEKGMSQKLIFDINACFEDSFLSHGFITKCLDDGGDLVINLRESTTPEFDKLHAVSDVSQKIGEFLDTYCSEKGYELCRLSTEKSRERYVPLCTPVNRLLADFFGINLDKVEAERKQALEDLRKKTHS